MIGSMLTLADFDNRLMDGFTFCKKVYRLLDEVYAAQDGVKLLRLRDRLTKKLIGELLPLTHYVRSHYTEGRQLRVRWVDGNQAYDAEIRSKGQFVKENLAKATSFVEVTGVMHENEHLRRRLLQEKGGSFGVRGISVDRKTKTITSEPHVYRGYEADDNLLKGILDAIAKKNAIAYPESTVLVVQCHPERLTLDDDWRHVIDGLRSANVDHRFSEVFLYEPVGRHTATLYPRREN